MTVAGMLTLAGLGWLAGATVWVVARSLAQGDRAVPTPACASCLAPLPATAWLPLYGLGTALRCPACDMRQPLGRLVLEMGMAAYFLAAGMLIDDPVRVMSAVLLAIPLVLIAAVDFWSRKIYPNLLALAALLGLLLSSADGLDGLLRSLQGMMAGAVIVAIYRFIARAIYPSLGLAPLGWADVLIAAMVGAMVRWPLVLGALFIGLAVAAVAGLALLLVQRAKRRQAALYGPFLCIGALGIILLRF